MKKLLRALIFLLSIVSGSAQNTFSSGILFDNPTFSYLKGPRLIQLADGSYLTVGKPGTSANQFFLTHYDISGSPVWQKQIDVSSSSTSSSYFYCNLTPLSDSGFLFLTYKLLYPSQHTNLVLSRFDKNGNITVQHSYYYPGNLYDPELFAITDSEYVLCGRTSQYTLQQDLYNQGVVFWKFDGSCNFTSQNYMRPNYSSPQFVSANVNWQFARDISGGYIISGQCPGMNSSGGVLIFRTDSTFNPSTGTFYDNSTTNLAVNDIQSDNAGGYWFIGETDSIVPYPYFHQMLAVMHYNSSNQLLSSKRYFSIDSTASFTQVFSAIDPSTGKLYVTRSLATLIYPVARPMQLAAFDSTGELSSAGSLSAAETAGIIVSDHQPVMISRGAENFWSKFTLLSRMDTTSMISCFDLGNPFSTSRPFTPPVANSIAINPMADSLLTPTIDSMLVVNTTFPVATNYCLTAGMNYSNPSDSPEVLISQQNNQLNIQYNAALPNAKCILYDVQGNVVLENMITNMYSINTSSIANGVYILRIDWNDQNTWSKKIVITH